MDSLLRRRTLLHAGFAGGLSLALPRAARACEFFTTTLRVTHPWTRATAAGERTAVVCMVFDQVSAPDRLIGIQTPVATRAELAGRAVNLAIRPGRTTTLGETGAVLRLVGLTQPLEIGRTYPLQLRFERGGVVNADLSVDYERAG